VARGTYPKRERSEGETARVNSFQVPGKEKREMELLFIKPVKEFRKMIASTFFFCKREKGGQPADYLSSPRKKKIAAFLGGKKRRKKGLKAKSACSARKDRGKRGGEDRTRDSSLFPGW